MNLNRASYQWANRPADERFWTITDARDHALKARAMTYEATEAIGRLRVEATSGDLELRGDAAQPYALTHWSFGQLCQRVAAPASYLRTLPATLAAQNLNHGLAYRAGGTDAQLLARQSDNAGAPTLRAMTSDYTRLWDADVLDRCIALEERGWKVPPARPVPGITDELARPATAADVLRGNAHSLSIREGDMIAPSGIYLSDRDLFVFLVDENTRINDGSEAGLMRGVFVTNSEVGAASLRLTCFLFRAVCGNHIVWDARNVLDVRIRHRGDIAGRAWRAFGNDVQRYLEASAVEEEGLIRAARHYRLGATREETIETAAKVTALPARTLDVAYHHVRDDVDGDPMTAWGLAQGVTRWSQASTNNQDRRDVLDRAAGRLVELAA